MNSKFAEIHERALKVAENYRRSEIELIDALIEVDQNKVFYSLGFNSLFQYSTKCLGLSEEVAYIFINVARKSKEVPALKDEIRNGSLTVSKAKRISSVINSSNQNHWLELAKISSKRDLEKEIAKVAPKEVMREKLSYIHPSLEVPENVSLKSINQETRVQLEVGISEELMIRIRRAQDVLSQKSKSSVRLETLISEMVTEFLYKHDPIKKAERQKIRGKLLGPGTAPPIGPRSARKFREHLPARLKHQVILKYQGRCSHEDALGQRCPTQRHLEIHHIVPVAMGGTNSLENLSLLCNGHHKVVHF